MGKIYCVITFVRLEVHFSLENITHGLVGFALAGIALGNPEIITTAERATIVATTAAASQLPDLDIVYLAFGKWAYLEQHRGWSHSIPAQVGSAIVLAAIARFVSGLPYSFLLFYALLGVGLHILLDFSNSFGTQALIPWSKWRVAWDLAPTFDPVMAAILGLGWLAWVSGRYPSRPAGLLALLGVGVWLLVRVGLHLWAARVVRYHTKELKSVIPTIKPWTWRYVANLPHGLVVQGEVNLITRKVVELGRLKADTEEPWIKLLRNNKEGQIFLNHSRHPHVELLQETREGSSVIRVTDLAAQKSAAEIEITGTPK
ncbi:MAG: membrane-bound metal-dependent hydrolase [Bacillota bacterium]|nr:MAG: membrane-bound metal-dependent hydrolase [Bacillota bacterium]